MKRKRAGYTEYPSRAQQKQPPQIAAAKGRERMAQKSVAGDLIGGIAKDPATQQLIAGLVMGAISKLLEDLLKRLLSGGLPGTSPVPTPVPTPTQTPVPTPTPVPDGRVISGLLLKVKGVKRNGVHIPPGELEKVKDLSDPLDDGDVLNLDVTPLDQFGEPILTGQPENEQLLVNPALGTDQDDSGDNHRLQYAVGGGDFEVNGTWRNYGCGPNLKVPRGFKGEATAVVSVYMTSREGKLITSNAIRARIKPWGN